MSKDDERAQVLWGEARRAWPNLRVSFDDFVAHVQAIGHPWDGMTPEIAADIYLVTGCLLRDAAALEAFDRSFLPMVDAITARLGRRGVDSDEARQAVRVRLFAGDSPRIREYHGKGSLRGWLRVVATRTLLNLTEARKDRAHGDVDHLVLLACDADPEMEYMKRAYAAVFREALAQAAKSLETRERALLRLALIDGLGIDALADLYGVHRSTAARWIQSAHQTLVARVRSILRSKMSLRDAELESVLRIVSVGLDTSLGHYLATQTDTVLEDPESNDPGE
jgi:RNA polymerase sigma-70 factor (ECF subfamily)